MATATAQNITTTRSCSICTYWQATQENLGECRRHAPQTVAFKVDDDVRFESRFPATKAEDWCGDFVSKE